MAQKNHQTSICEAMIKYNGVHLLGLPLEIRQLVYFSMQKCLSSAQTNTWTMNPATPYDSLPFVCRQLYHETTSDLFVFIATQNQIARVVRPDNRLTHLASQGLRALYLEVELTSLPQNVVNFSKLGDVLTYLQLSLQELHLLCVGDDTGRQQTEIQACGKGPIFQADRPVPAISYQHQAITQKMKLFQPLMILNRLRVLRVENASMPLFHSMVCLEKPYLEALYITADPRSTVAIKHIDRFGGSLAYGLMRHANSATSSPIKFLELDVNAILSAGRLICNVVYTLEHFTLRIPNLDLMYPIDTDRNQLMARCYDNVAYIIQLLPLHALRMRVLRLRMYCESLGLRNCLILHNAVANLVAHLSLYLPHMRALEQLEIHLSGVASDLNINGLIKWLPDRLKRLYVSDQTISSIELNHQVRSRYLAYETDEYDLYEGSNLSRNYLVDHGLKTFNSTYPMLESCRKAKTKAFICLELNKCQFVTYGVSPSSDTDSNTNVVLVRKLSISDTYLADGGNLVGEDLMRYDDISLSGGQLGFIEYEYQDPRPSDYDGYNEDLIRLLKLNGILLDREHNMHLQWTQKPDAAYGIPISKVHPQFTGDTNALDKKESATFSNHFTIHCALTELAELGHSKSAAKEAYGLSDCLPCHDYFGMEDIAEEIFACEPVAKIECQVKKPGIDVVIVKLSKRHRWMCPEADVPAVGSFPRPKLPREFQ